MNGLAHLLSETPLPDIHAKPRESPPELTRFQAIQNHHAICMLSAEFQRVMGLRAREIGVFEGPPPMPQELQARFFEGCGEYGVDTRMGVTVQGSGSMMMNLDSAVRLSLGDVILGSIREAMEKITIEDRLEVQGPLAYDHNLTLGPASTLTGNGIWTPESSSTIQQPYSDPSIHSASYVYPQRPANLRHPTQQHPTGVETSDHNSYYQTSNEEKENHENTQQTNAATTVLFPSPPLGRNQAWPSFHQQQQHISFAPQNLPQGGHRRALSNKLASQFPKPIPLQEQLRYELPKSNLRPASLNLSRKRPAVCQDEPESSCTRARPSDTGLPLTLAIGEPISGNYPCLLNILLTWSITMNQLQGYLPNPYLMSINPAFPLTFTPPAHENLLAVGFYDTSITPAKELRYIGPGETGQISWNEVDVFTYADNNAGEEKLGLSRLNQSSGLSVPLPNLAPLPSYKHKVYGEGAGEGRWAYILLKGHAPMPSGPTARLQAKPPPHIIIGWPANAITERQSCDWTVYPDQELKFPPMGPPLAPGPKTRSKTLAPINVLSHLDPMLCKKGIRAASTASHPCANLSPSDGTTGVDDTRSKNGGLTLIKEVIKMEKGGHIPLIEGYRVDAGAWKEWMAAVGKGSGQIVLWKEKEY